MCLRRDYTAVKSFSSPAVIARARVCNESNEGREEMEKEMSLSGTRSGWSTECNAKWQEQSCGQPKKPAPMFNEQEMSM